jgi:predicted RNA-binding protein YlqC (UPF0109 family)
MKDLVVHMARAIVDYPDKVVVTEEIEEDHIVYRLRVADSDMGKVIGKEGRIANAMRTLLKVAAIRKGTRAILEIGEGVGPRRVPPRAAAEREPEPEFESEREPEPEFESEPEPEPEPQPDL